MIFLTLFAVGVIAAWLVGRLRRARARQDLAFGAAGAFLLGGLVVGLAERTPGVLDPLVLALGAVGGAGAALLDAYLERGGKNAGAAVSGRPRKRCK